MLFSENIFFLFFFTVPGCTYVLYNQYIKLITQKEADEVARVSAAIFFSFLAFVPNFFVALFMKEKLPNSWIIPSVGINIVLSFSLCIIWGLVKNYLVTKLRNLVGMKITGVTQSYDSVLSEIIYKEALGSKRVNKGLPPIDVTNGCVVTIEVGDIKSCGIIDRCATPSSENKAFVLSCCSAIESLFSNSMDTLGYNMFDVVLYEYIDVTDGYKITFYDTTKYYEYLDATSLQEVKSLEQ